MGKTVHIAAASLFAAFAALCLVELASAAPEVVASAETCQTAICLVALF